MNGNSRDILGAVLAGGRSSRMGRDKAGLLMGQDTFLARALRAVRSVCPEAVISLRPDAPCRAAAEKAGKTVWDDGLHGPMGGLAATWKKPGRADSRPFSHAPATCRSYRLTCWRSCAGRGETVLPARLSRPPFSWAGRSRSPSAPSGKRQRSLTSVPRSPKAGSVSSGLCPCAPGTYSPVPCPSPRSFPT